MSLTISKAEGVTVFTVTSNPKSQWPLICQVLGTVCCSPFCSVSQSLKQQLSRVFTVLGTLQILVGLMNLGFGGITSIYGRYSAVREASYWLGGVFIVVGIICILAEKFPSQCLISCTVVVNLISAALALTAIGFYAVDLGDMFYVYTCNQPDYQNAYRYRYDETTPSPMKKEHMNELWELCKHYSHILRMVEGGLDIMMIVLAVLQLCVTISMCVLSLQILCKKKKGEMEDPELQKPLMEEVLSSPAC